MERTLKAITEEYMPTNLRWLTYNKVKMHRRKSKRRKKLKLKETDLVSKQLISAKLPGRPTGTTLVEKRERLRRFIQMKNHVTITLANNVIRP